MTTLIVGVFCLAIVVIFSFFFQEKQRAFKNLQKPVSSTWGVLAQTFDAEDRRQSVESETIALAQKQLRDLVVTHLSTDVSGWLAQNIERGAVRLRFVSHPVDELWFRADLERAGGDTADVAVLTIDVDILTSMVETQQQKQLYLWRVISEMRETLGGGFPVYASLNRRYQVPFVVPDAEIPGVFGVMLKIFTGERELARHMGVTKTDPFYQRWEGKDGDTTMVRDCVDYLTQQYYYDAAAVANLQRYAPR